MTYHAGDSVDKCQIHSPQSRPRRGRVISYNGTPVTAQLHSAVSRRPFRHTDCILYRHRNRCAPESQYSSHVGQATLQQDDCPRLPLVMLSRPTHYKVMNLSPSHPVSEKIPHRCNYRSEYRPLRGNSSPLLAL